MKKFLLSFFVIAIFIAYIFSLRNQVMVISNSGNNQTKSDSGAPVSNNIPGGDNAALPANRIISKGYKDGEYVGDIVDAYYGNVQVKISINGGEIINVQFLDYPKDRRTSIEINSQAMPLLKSEVIQAQSARVDIISGATQTSEAFIQSLSSALDRAQI